MVLDAQGPGGERHNFQVTSINEHAIKKFSFQLYSSAAEYGIFPSTSLNVIKSKANQGCRQQLTSFNAQWAQHCSRVQSLKIPKLKMSHEMQQI